ncbi:MAG: Rieske 2Fe-2S domain-containing protein [Pseudomonadales bacterium]|nr:Rieske 2Fe-2S domain-containing protein [Pseudomonadales bacterium]
MSEFVTVASTNDIEENKALVKNVDGMSVLVCQTGGEFLAVENRCSHQNKPLAEGRIRNGYIFCPVHGMRFRLSTGEAIGQLTDQPIRVFESRVVDEQIQLRI